MVLLLGQSHSYIMEGSGGFQGFLALSHSAFIAHSHATPAGHYILESFLELSFLPLSLAIPSLKHWGGITLMYNMAGAWPGNPET